MRQQGAALGAEFVKILLAARLGVGLESSKGRAKRPPLQAGDADVIDDIACPQRRQRLACFGIGLKFGKLFDVDIERVEKQPAVRRIGAAIARAIVEQGMQRIEADAVGTEMIGEFDQAGEIGEVAHAPVARGADAVKLGREQPAAVELATKRPFRRRNQRHVLGGRGVAHLKPVDARRQVLGPVDGVIRALALGDNPRVRNDFPRHRKPGCSRELGSRRPAGADHDRLADQRSRGLRRQGIQDDFERGGVRHTAVTLAVQELGLDSLGFGLSKKVHSARTLHANIKPMSRNCPIKGRR